MTIEDSHSHEEPQMTEAEVRDHHAEHEEPGYYIACACLAVGAIFGMLLSWAW